MEDRAKDGFLLSDWWIVTVTKSIAAGSRSYKNTISISVVAASSRDPVELSEPDCRWRLLGSTRT